MGCWDRASCGTSTIRRICEDASAEIFVSSNSEASVMRNETVVVVCDEREGVSHVTCMVKTSTPCL